MLRTSSAGAGGDHVKECGVSGVYQRGEADMRRSRHKHYSAASRRNLWWRRPDDSASSSRLRLNQSEG